MNYKKLTMLSLLLCLPFLGGCGKSLRYSPKTIQHLSTASADSASEKNNVIVMIKRFDPQMNEYFFNKPHLNYVAYQLTINNRSDKEWSVSPSQLGIQTVPLEEVRKDISPSFGRSVGMFFIPIAGLNLIAGGIYTHQQFKTKACIAEDLGEKIFQNALIIKPNRKCSTIFFVRRSAIRPRMNLELLCDEQLAQTLEFNLIMG